MAISNRNPSVLLISMPLSSPHHPSIGLALIQGSLKARGISSRIRHFHLDFVDYCGVSEFELLNDERYFLALVGEWIFSTVLYEKRAPDLGFFTEVLLRHFGRFFSVSTLRRIASLQPRMEGFIASCLEAIDWSEYDIVGFSTSFQQTMASLALAKRVKERFPDITIVFGGANCESEMGDALKRHYSFVDVVSSGEAENSFPELVTRLRTDRREELRPRPEINTLPIVSIQPVSKEAFSMAMDDLPYPDYSDFLSDRAALPAVENAYRLVPLFETSRGCWWGQKHHCTFCGLNGLTMTYRSKTPERAASELSEIASRFGREILVVDNILDHRYFSSFVESVSAMVPPVLLHYEVKANLNEAQVESLAEAGIRKIQPGIESLSSRILTLINKGTTLLRNVQLLKLAAESGIFVDWGHLYGVPGETAADYLEIIKLVPKLHHLTPPGSHNRVRADRFSPYFKHPETFGIRIAPLASYRYIFPFNNQELSSLAYHFDIENEEVSVPKEVESRFFDSLDHWRTTHSSCALTIEFDGQHACAVEDCRLPGPPARYEFDGLKAVLLQEASQIIGIQTFKRSLYQELPGHILEEAIQDLCDKSLLLREKDSVLCIALRQPGLRTAPQRAELSTAYFHSYAFHDRKTVKQTEWANEEVDSTRLSGSR